MSIQTIPHISILPSFYRMDITPSVSVSQLRWIRTDLEEDFQSGKGVVQKPTDTHPLIPNKVNDVDLSFPDQPYLSISITEMGKTIKSGIFFFRIL